MGLFGPAWMASKPSKQQQALDAVAKISDQQQLAEVFLRAPLGAVRVARSSARIARRGPIIIKLALPVFASVRTTSATGNGAGRKLSSPWYLPDPKIASCEHERLHVHLPRPPAKRIRR